MRIRTSATLLVLLLVAVGLSACQPVMPVSAGSEPAVPVPVASDSVGKVLQIHFQYDITPDEYRAAATSLSDSLAQFEGMRWKIWTINEDTGEAGGLVLFDDEESRQVYLDGPYADAIGSSPVFHDAVIKKFDIIEDATQATRGPIDMDTAYVSGPAGKVLQVHFEYDISVDDYRAAATSLAGPLAQFEGMRWKIWTINEASAEAGGLVLFDDEVSRQAYLDGPFADAIGSNPVFHDVVIKKFDVIEDATQATRGPVGIADR